MPAPFYSSTSHLLKARVPTISISIHVLCLRWTIYAHLVQARVPADPARVPATYDLRTFIARTSACTVLFKPVAAMRDRSEETHQAERERMGRE